ncbi:MAG TPA: FixH family protein [Bryobacteraceae bacterium]|nr:FixH family protein [Bryobacteraceae bacterium]
MSARTLLPKLLLLACALLPAESKRTAGKYQVTLRIAPEGLFAQEESEIEFHVEDSSLQDPLTGAAPVIRADAEVSIDMPAMTGMPQFRETAHPEAVPGDYGVHPTFSHGGDYVMRIVIKPPQEEAFHVEFPLSVQDAAAGHNRKQHPPRFQLQFVSSPKTPKAGEPADLQFSVRERDNPKTALTAFDRTHEKLLHLIVVRDDLSHFAHVHPTFGADGIFRTQHVFPAGGEYHLFADVAPKGAGSQVLMAKLKVSGSPGPSPPTANTSEGPTVQLQNERERFPVKKTTRVVFTVQPTEGVEPYLGARAHLIAIYQDAITFVHAHADESQPFDGTFVFLGRFPQPGRYRAWVQFKYHGQVITREFTLEAKDQ